MTEQTTTIDPIREAVIAAMESQSMTVYGLHKAVRAAGYTTGLSTIQEYASRKKSLSTRNVWPLLQILGLELVESTKKKKK